MAQSAHSNLKDPEKLNSFKRISHTLMCTCGCNMPLYYCNHTGHCNAWPMRAAIDSLLAEGKSEQFITNGFTKGFGNLVMTHEGFAMTRSAEYNYLVERFSQGLGEAGYSRPQSYTAEILSIIAGLILLAIAVTFIHKRYKKEINQNVKPAPMTKEQSELLNTLYD